MEKKDYSCITPEIFQMAELCKHEGVIDKTLYETYKVNRGL